MTECNLHPERDEKKCWRKFDDGLCPSSSGTRCVSDAVKNGNYRVPLKKERVMKDPREI